jgi:hypothetical protein
LATFGHSGHTANKHEDEDEDEHEHEHEHEVNTMSQGYWISSEGKVLNIHSLPHEEFAIRANLVQRQENEDATRLECLKRGFVRVRQYRNHWSVQAFSRSFQTEPVKTLISANDKFAEIVLSFLDTRETWRTSVSKL